MYLGVDGGGTKTAFLLLDRAGNEITRHTGGSSYYPEVTIDGVRQVIAEGVAAILAQAGVAASAIAHAFFGLPAFGEDGVEDARLATLPDCVLSHAQYTVGNDMVCSWAGALAGEDGISVVAGTGSIAYGEYRGRQARAGGWGDVFGDEGSAYWIAREGLAAFSRMSDGRCARGPLYEMLIEHFQLTRAIDLAGQINKLPSRERSSISQLSKLIAAAAIAGDSAAAEVFGQAALELADLVVAVRSNLRVARATLLPVSYTGGVFNVGNLVLEPFRAELAQSSDAYEVRPPLQEPVVGAALYAARCGGGRLPDRTARAQ